MGINEEQPDSNFTQEHLDRYLKEAADSKHCYLESKVYAYVGRVEFEHEIRQARIKALIHEGAFEPQLMLEASLMMAFEFGYMFARDGGVMQIDTSCTHH